MATPARAPTTTPATGSKSSGFRISISPTFLQRIEAIDGAGHLRVEAAELVAQHERAQQHTVTVFWWARVCSPLFLWRTQLTCL